MSTSTSTSTDRPARRRSLAAVGVMVLLAALAAFLATRAPGTTASEAAAPTGPISVGLADYGFTDLPSTVPAGTTFTVDNHSETELHEFVAVLLPEDEQRSAEELVQLPQAEFAELLPGVRTVLLQAPGSDEVIPAVGDGTLDEIISDIDQLTVAHSINDYIVQIAAATRRHPDLRLGVSTRGTLSLLRIARAFAATDDRDFVTPDDVKALVGPVFGHRVALSAEAELRGLTIESLMADIADSVPVPRTSGA